MTIIVPMWLVWVVRYFLAGVAVASLVRWLQGETASSSTDSQKRVLAVTCILAWPVVLPYMLVVLGKGVAQGIQDKRSKKP